MSKLINFMFVVLLLTGCGKIYDYELKRISDICGGYDQIKYLWIDATTTKAVCKDDNRVSVKD